MRGVGCEHNLDIESAEELFDPLAKQADVATRCTEFHGKVAKALCSFLDEVAVCSQRLRKGDLVNDLVKDFRLPVCKFREGKTILFG